MALHRIIERVKAKHLPAVITFIDFRKAFNTILRGKMMKTPTHTLLQAIEVMYMGKLTGKSNFLESYKGTL